MKIDLSKIVVPKAVYDLPRDKRGYPIPFFQFVPPDYPETGRVDFRVTDQDRRMECLQGKLCGICGQTLGKIMYFIGGPASVQSRFFTDPPMHQQCARFAIAVCPFLNNPTYKATSDSAVIPNTIKDPLPAAERPEKMGLIRVDGYEPARFRDGNTGKTHPMIYFYANEPLAIEWF